MQTKRNANRTARKTTRKAAKKTTKRPTKKTTRKTTRKTAKKTAKKPTKKPTKKTAKKPAKRVAKRVAKKTTRKTAKKTAKKSAARPAEPAAKKAAARVVERAQSPAMPAPDTARKKPSTPPSQKLSKPRDLKKDKRPILVPLDFSAHSEAALVYAAHLSDRMGVPLAVLHVVHDPGEAPGYYRVKGQKKQLRRLEDVAGDLMDDFMTRMTKRYPKRPAIKKAKRLLVTGLPATRILEIAKQVKPKMVVMGSAGRTAMSRFLLGSKSEQVLRMCPYPVTIVKMPEGKP